LLLLIFGGELAVGALFSIGAIAQYVAFTIPIFIRIFFVGNRFRAGPWNLGRLSMPIGIVACSFVVLMTPIMCFPAYKGRDLDDQDMNWTAVVYGVPMCLTLIWWVVSARKWFKGPKVNLEHMMLGRDETTYVGQEVEGVKVDSASSTGSQAEQGGGYPSEKKTAFEVK